MPDTPFPIVPVEIVPDPRWPWNPIFVGEATPGASRIEEDELGGCAFTVDFTSMGMRRERLGLRRWWRYWSLSRSRREKQRYGRRLRAWTGRRL